MSVKHRGPVHASGRRYEKFAAEYIKTGFNGQRAVLNCGFTDKPKSAKIIANRLLTYVVVNDLVEKHMEKAKMDADEVLNRLAQIARKDDVKFTGADVVKASELIGKGHKLFTERTETIDLTEHESARTFIANEIASLSGDPIEREAELQRLFANKTAPNYDPKLDVNQNPATWPSGRSLITPEATEAVN